MKPRPKNSKIPHGHPACADYGCKREECLSARRRAQKEREYLRTVGRPCRPSTDRTAQHIARLRTAGMSDAAIRATAGIGYDPFYNAARPGGITTRATEARILAVPMPAVAEGTVNCARINGRGTLLRLQALMAVGWPQAVIAQRMDNDSTWTSLSQVMRRLTLGGQYVTLGMAISVQRVYEQLWNQDPLQHGVSPLAVRRAKSKAKAGKWPMPMALDDDALDDPRNGRLINPSPSKPRLNAA
ncbi:hypothetical protein [Streptomyces antimycoticus]|uniref:hypothetical protein n=1 Tax=Streptomyces TaxID=1883 RepID=UPI0033C4730F